MFNINGLYTVVVGAFNSFLAANPGAGRANGTQITDAWLNDVQGELLNPLTVAGVVPAANTPTQVLQSLKRIFGGNRTLLAATTALTPDMAGLVVVNAAGGNVVLTLPLNNAANGTPLEFIFARTDTSANTVTVQDAGSDTDAPGAVTSATVSPGAPLWLRGDGASVWDIVMKSAAGTAYALLAGSATQGFAAAPSTTATGVATLGQVGGSTLQTWKNETASRALGTNYTNSGNAPIKVSVSMGSGAGMSIYTGPPGAQVLVGTADTNSSGSPYLAAQLFTEVQPGNAYSVTGTGSIINWAELS